MSSYEMTSLRKEDLSLYLHIKDVVLRNFREKEEYSPLQLMPELCDYASYVYEIVTDLEPSPTERGRGLVYFDPPSGGVPCEPYPSVSGLNGDGHPAFGTPEQSDSVVLYEMVDPLLCDDRATLSGVEVSWQDYMIDYIDGRIISPVKLTNPAITYTWNYVSVVDEWAAIEAADPPVVVIDLHGTDKAGYQLGGGKRTVRKVDIHVFASHPAERNDIVEALYEGLYNKSCPLYDFPTGSVLDYDGTFYGRREMEDKAIELGIDLNGDDYNNKLTYLFDRSHITSVSRLHFDSVTARHVNLPLVMSRGRDEIMLSDLNAYRSKVSFDMFSYDDRNTGRIYE
jgi:hypothetical protein